MPMSASAKAAIKKRDETVKGLALLYANALVHDDFEMQRVFEERCELLKMRTVHNTLLTLQRGKVKEVQDKFLSVNGGRRTDLECQTEIAEMTEPLLEHDFSSERLKGLSRAVRELQNSRTSSPPVEILINEAAIESESKSFARRFPL